MEDIDMMLESIDNEQIFGEKNACLSGLRDNEWNLQS